jgi:hypothetical protein
MFSVRALLVVLVLGAAAGTFAAWWQTVQEATGQILPQRAVHTTASGRDGVAP